MADAHGQNPYVGPRPFERADGPLFFGRDGEARQLLSLVVAHRVVLLYAASGAGKTSLLNAGLLPLLEEEQFQVLPIARIRGLAADEPAQAVGNIYAYGILSNWAADLDVAGAATSSPDRTLIEFLCGHEHPRDAHGLLRPRAVIIDQFEELFTTYPQRWGQREAFLREIAEALEADPLLRVLLALREDYLGHLEAHSALFAGRLRHRFRLEPLRAPAALSAVTGPLEPTGRAFAPGVAEKLVADLLRFRVDTGAGTTLEVQGEFAEPVQLQVVCHSLWDELPPSVVEISEQHLRTFGNVDEALAQYYAAAVRAAAAAAGASERELRRRIESAFITTGGTRGTGYRAPEATAGVANTAIDELEHWHVLRAEWRAGARWYELTHDRLIEPLCASNRAFEAAHARRRWRRTITLAGGAALAALVALAAALTSLFSSGSSEAGAEKLCASCSASVIRWKLTNVRAGRAVGRYAVQLRSGTGREFPLAWQVSDRRTGSALGPPTVAARLTPRSDPDVASGRISLTLPRRPGDYLVALTVYAPGAGPGTTPLVSSEVPLRVDDRSPTPTPTPTPTTGPVPTASPPPAETMVPAVSLTLTLVGGGTGVVTSAPSGINCGSICTAQFRIGTTVALRAAPAPGSLFQGWQGACAGTRTCSVAVREDAAVTAVFAPRASSVG